MFRRTLENLRERPAHQRTAIAAWISLGVVIVLFLGWVVYFFNEVVTTPAPDLQNIGASDQNGLQQASQQLQQAFGTTTQFVDVEGNVETQPISTTTYQSQ